jgi:hypothetical protein
MVTLLVFSAVVLAAGILWYRRWSYRREAEMLDYFAAQFGLSRRPDESNDTLRFRIETTIVTRGRKSVKYGA